ncbi:hypothetical protein PVK06_000456 [Gossypium arboreum]|uniref:Disease resistance protein At4g27190-like leucine-rich repeats domain-containing protein n=1 Tax=Gossypium arboreum TaxID=29729 RepID=A0ABR0QYB4_GOSAR|nr:hypothetical protein PVK06_000456 [Gossypium arboreum]
MSVSTILQKLKLVRIYDCKNLKVVFQMEEVEENEAPLLSNLKFLHLQNLLDLRCIWELPTQHARLESLVKLRIVQCPHLKSLFPLSLAQSLVVLNELYISFSDELKQIVRELEGDEGEISSTINSHTSLCFPKLTELSIYHCPGLEYIFPTSLASHGLQGLTLEICGCPKLKQVFRVVNDSMLQHQQSLRSLSSFSIDGCPLLTDSVVHLEAEKASISDVRLSAFKDSFKTSKQLELIAIKDHNLVLEANEDGLNGITSLSLESWKPYARSSKLEYVVPIALAQGLPALESLSVSWCDELKQVFGMPNEQDGVQHHGCMLLPSLQYLKLSWLRNLTSFVPQNYIVKAPSLKIMKAEGCSKVMNLPIQQANNQLELTLEELSFSMEDIDGEDVKSCNMINTELRQKSSDFEYIPLGTSEPLDLFNMIRLRGVATNPRELTIHNCNNLTCIIPVMFIQNFPQLSFLEIKSCENLKQIIGNGDILASSSSSQGPHLEFPRLKQIVLENLSKLESFSPVGYHLEFPCLDWLDIKQCSKVITNFNADYLTLIVHAKTDQVFILPTLFYLNFPLLFLIYMK